MMLGVSMSGRDMEPSWALTDEKVPSARLVSSIDRNIVVGEGLGDVFEQHKHDTWALYSCTEHTQQSGPPNVKLPLHHHANLL